jgi:nicotinamidase-related amidase
MGRYVNADPYPYPFNGDLRPDNTTLIVIDMQIDFCGKGGYVDKMGYDLSLTQAPIEPLKNLLSVMRSRSYSIIHTREGHRPDLSDLPENKRWRSQQIGAGIGDPGPCGRILVRGEPG